jgi:hypothetical protein
MRLRFFGTPASAVTVTVPATVTSKQFLVTNATGRALIIKYAATAGVVVSNGETLPVWADGTNVFALYSYAVADVRRFGATGDGVTDDTAAFTAGIAACPVLFVPDPPVGYRITSMLTLTNGRMIRGQGKWTTRIFKDFNGDLLTMENETGLQDLWLDGEGGTRTGRGILIPAGDGKQVVRSCRIDDFASYCIDFLDEDSGSQSLWDDLQLGQTVGTSVGQEAVRGQGTLTASARPRHFININTQGLRFMDIGPCNNLFIVNCRIGDVLWSDDSRGVMAYGTRFGGTVNPMVIRGANHAVTGNDFGQSIEIASGVQSLTLMGNSYNTLPITDNAVHPSNRIEFQEIMYRETLKVEAGGAFKAFGVNDATPSVKGYTAWQTANSSTTTITDFDDGVDGQRIIIRLDANTAITHNSSLIRMRGGLSIPVGTVNADQQIEFISIAGIWFEQCRNWEYLQGSATYDPPSLADGAGATTTVTVSGAALGDFVDVSFSLDLQGITVTGYVSSSNTVSVRFQNETTGTLDLGSGTLRARVRRGT